MNVLPHGPYCILCRSACPPNMNYCLPQCEGRKQGACHFFCQQCWDRTLSRMACELATCTGCAIGHPAFPMNHARPIQAVRQSQVLEEAMEM